jgi:hypothetical protein
MKRINGTLLMRHKHATCPLVEVMQIGKTPSSPNPVFHHTPETFNRIEVVTAPGRQDIQAKLLVPVCQRRRELVGPMDATAIDDHDHLFSRMAKERHDLMDILAKPLSIKLGHDLIEAFRGPILDGTQDTEHDPTGHATPTPIAPPRLTFEVLFAFDLACTEGACGQAKTLGGAAPPARPWERKTPDDGFIFIQQNKLAPLSTVLQSSQFTRRPGQLSRVGRETSRGATVVDVFFLRRRGHSHG